jgi:AraC family transcriptional activator of pobA
MESLRKRRALERRVRNTATIDKPRGPGEETGASIHWYISDSSMPHSVIPTFLLYGEAAAEDSEARPAEFAHIETIASRSSLYDWEIAPHRHVQSVQALLVTSGQVAFQCDGTVRILDAPCYMAVPIGAVHGFRFTPETSGYVLSLSADFAGRGQGADDALLRLLTHGASGTIPAADLARITWLCGEMLAIQADWRAPQPLFLALAEALVRSLPAQVGEGARADAAGAADEERLAGFRTLIELHLREHRSVAWYAQHLGTTPRTLTRICRRALDRTPTELLHARLVLDAQRLLCFTNASIVQVAEELGFSDCSYFSRFYQRMTGRRPNRDKMQRAGVHNRNLGAT